MHVRDGTSEKMLMEPDELGAPFTLLDAELPAVQLNLLRGPVESASLRLRRPESNMSQDHIEELIAQFEQAETHALLAAEADPSSETIQIFKWFGCILATLRPRSRKSP